MDLLQSPPPGSSVSADRADRTGDLPRGNFLRTSKNAVATFVVALALAALLAGILACGGDPTGGSGGHGDGDSLFPRLSKVTGHIDRVEADTVNPRHFRGLDLTDADGRQWQFRSEGWVGVSVGHLKDHQIHGTTVTVWYEGQPGKIQLARFVGD